MTLYSFQIGQNWLSRKTKDILTPAKEQHYYSMQPFVIRDNVLQKIFEHTSSKFRRIRRSRQTLPCKKKGVRHLFCIINIRLFHRKFFLLSKVKYPSGQALTYE